MPRPEQQARTEIDRLPAAAGWAVQDVKAADLQAAHGVALREFESNLGYGSADHLLYVGGKACGGSVRGPMTSDPSRSPLEDKLLRLSGQSLMR